MEDSDGALDLDRLQALLVILKDAEVSHFRYKDLELMIGAIEEDKQAGFIPAAKQAGAVAVVAQQEAPSQYHKAFGGKMPTFRKPNLPKADNEG